jgi:murein DD-endopeptidase MepM/ murein hydrolase activator NlpD
LGNWFRAVDRYNLLMIAALALLTLSQSAAVDPDLSLVTRPSNIYKVSEPDRLQSEAWITYIVVRDKKRRSLAVKEASLKMYSGDEWKTTSTISKGALESLKLPVAPGGDAIHAFVHRVTSPRADKIDRMQYSLTLEAPGGASVVVGADIPVLTYTVKTELRYPLNKSSMLVNGYGVDGGHQAWGQIFALDFLALNDSYGPMNPPWQKNADYSGWGAEVLAPAAGTVAYARNDVPDQPSPFDSDQKLYSSLSEPIWAAGGNVVAIDHGNGEFSVLCHMQKGSVKVKKGDKIEARQVIGQLGSSGEAFGPHLHYQLQAALDFNRCDSLPVKFVDVDTPMWRGKYFTPPKR